MSLSQPTALVINLKESVDRRKFQEKQLRRLKMPYRFFEAVGPQNVSEEEFLELSKTWVRPLSKSEVCCALSHKKIWNIVLESGKPWLILEDDCVLSSRTPKVVSDLYQTTNLEFVTLEARDKRVVISKAGQVLPDGITGLFKLYHMRGGAASYLLWPSGAEKLLSYTKNRLPISDSAIGLATGLKKHQINPACSIQTMFLEKKFKTTISKDYKDGEMSALDSLKFKLRRIGVESLVLMRKIGVLPISKTVQIEYRSD